AVARIGIVGRYASQRHVGVPVKGGERTMALIRGRGRSPARNDENADRLSSRGHALSAPPAEVQSDGERGTAVSSRGHASRTPPVGERGDGSDRLSSHGRASTTPPRDDLAAAGPKADFTRHGRTTGPPPQDEPPDMAR